MEAGLLCNDIIMMDNENGITRQARGSRKLYSENKDWHNRKHNDNKQNSPLKTEIGFVCCEKRIWS
jgi:hypothetical protein